MPVYDEEFKILKFLVLSSHGLQFGMFIFKPGHGPNQIPYSKFKNNVKEAARLGYLDTKALIGSHNELSWWDKAELRIDVRNKISDLDWLGLEYLQ
ncbi:hypothetical protein HI914_01223 [Erysiphe necator]|nr:hypothetical protein HI914_01223 [Erysiphe necator]